MPLTIEEGARVFRGLRLGSATVEAFVSAIQERAGVPAAGVPAAWELVGLDRKRLARLVDRAEQLLETPTRAPAEKSYEAERLLRREHEATRP